MGARVNGRGRGRDRGEGRGWDASTGDCLKEILANIKFRSTVDDFIQSQRHGFLRRKSLSRLLRTDAVTQSCANKVGQEVGGVMFWDKSTNTTLK